MNRLSFERHRRCIGGVLLVTLWALFFLGALALAIGAHVAADVRFASAFKARTAATMLARAGAERAAMDVLLNPTNWQGEVKADFGNDEDSFKDSDVLPGGTFSVMYSFVESETGLTATNYGVLRESCKIDLNGSRPDIAKRLMALGLSVDLVNNIVEWPSVRKERFGPSASPSTLAYESLHELRLVDGVTESVYARLLPHVTIYKGDTYGATSVGTAGPSRNGAEAAVRRVTFVFDRETGTFVYWFER